MAAAISLGILRRRFALDCLAEEAAPLSADGGLLNRRIKVSAVTAAPLSLDPVSIATEPAAPAVDPVAAAVSVGVAHRRPLTLLRRVQNVGLTRFNGLDICAHPGGTKRLASEAVFWRRFIWLNWY